MSKTTDWLPASRDGQLALCRSWINIAGGNASAWGIPETVIQELTRLMQEADAALTAAKNESTRTPVATAQCRSAFEAMIAKMRDTKRRYFLTPPLQEADYIALGLKPHGSMTTPPGTPASQVTIETFLVGRHELGVRIMYVTGTADDPANKGYRIWYSTLPQGETPPSGPNELRNSFFTRRRKDVISFEFGDSGKICYMAAQVENGEKKGPWGALVSALIP
jgi:hypothetical protein